MNIVQFAKIAGFSTATISRAFHEPEKTRPETRERILDLADKLGYYPSASGRALVKGRYDAMGLVWPLEVEGAGVPFDAACTTPPLATYRLPLDEMTGCAVGLALGKRVRSRQFAATFVQGGSVRPAAME